MRKILQKSYDFFVKSTSGMVYGLFATLIIGVIIDQIGKLTNFDFTLFNQTWNIGATLIIVAGIVKSFMGIGIGVGIGLVFKKDGLKLVSLAVSGGIAASVTLFGKADPLVIYVVVAFTYLILDLIFKKKTPFDIILIPFVAIIFSTLLSFLIFPPISAFTTAVGNLVAGVSSVGQLFVMGLLLSVIMGMLLTSPMSSAAIAISFSIGGIAGGAALIGCIVNMLGFAIMGRKANSLGVTLSVAFGTSMLQFKNILKKPVIWLPIIIVSAIVGPMSTLLFKMETDPSGSGMGTSGLVGQFATFEAMGNTPMTWISIFVFQFLIVSVLMFVADLLFKKAGVYKDADLVIEE